MVCSFAADFGFLSTHPVKSPWFFVHPAYLHSSVDVLTLPFDPLASFVEKAVLFNYRWPLPLGEFDFCLPLLWMFTWCSICLSLCCYAFQCWGHCFVLALAASSTHRANSPNLAVEWQATKAATQQIDQDWCWLKRFLPTQMKKRCTGTECSASKHVRAFELRNAHKQRFGSRFGILAAILRPRNCTSSKSTACLNMKTFQRHGRVGAYYHVLGQTGMWHVMASLLAPYVP